MIENSQDIKKKILNLRNFFATHQTLDTTFRIKSLRKLKKAILENEKDIFKALHQDLHKSDFESFSTEVGIILTEIDYQIKHLRKWSREEHKFTPFVLFPSRSKIAREPYGVVLVIAPWNYPFQLLLNPLVAAIAAGNCVMLKTSPYAPATATIVEHIVRLALEEGHVNICHGNRDVNQQLLAQRFDFIFFTGSPALGKIVMEAAAAHLTPVVLELGGKSPCIVDQDADVPTAARRIIWGKTLNSGQTCVAPDYLLVHESVKKQLLTEMRTAIKEFFGENPQAAEDYPRIVSGKAMQRLIGYLKEGKIVMGGAYDEKERYIAPTIIENLPEDAALWQEEIFGPIFPLKTFSDFDEMLQFVQQREKPLALYYFSTCKKKIKRIIRETSSGGVCINDVLLHVGTHHIPFGGIGNSGMGNYHGKYGFETFSHQKSIVTSHPSFDIKIKYPPYQNKLKILKRVW